MSKRNSAVRASQTKNNRAKNIANIPAEIALPDIGIGDTVKYAERLGNDGGGRVVATYKGENDTRGPLCVWREQDGRFDSWWADELVIVSNGEVEEQRVAAEELRAEVAAKSPLDENGKMIGVGDRVYSPGQDEYGIVRVIAQKTIVYEVEMGKTAAPGEMVGDHSTNLVLLSKASFVQPINVQRLTVNEPQSLEWPEAELRAAMHRLMDDVMRMDKELSLLVQRLDAPNGYTFIETCVRERFTSLATATTHAAAELVTNGLYQNRVETAEFAAEYERESEDRNAA